MDRFQYFSDTVNAYIQKNINQAEQDGKDGYELLKEKLKEKYNITEAQAVQTLNGKGVQCVITLLAEESGLLDEAAKWAVDRAIENTKEAEKRANEQYHRYLDASRKLKPVDEAWGKLRQKQEEFEESRDDFEALKMEWQDKYEAQKRKIQELQQLETAEARDRVRMAMIFKENVDGSQRSPQNQTAYIAGLASILANSPVWSQNRTNRNSSADSEDFFFASKATNENPEPRRGMPPKSKRTKH